MTSNIHYQPFIYLKNLSEQATRFHTVINRSSFITHRTTRTVEQSNNRIIEQSNHRTIEHLPPTQTPLPVLSISFSNKTHKTPDKQNKSPQPQKTPEYSKHRQVSPATVG